MKKILLLIVALITVGGAKATVLWTGDFETGNWESGITLEKDVFTSVVEGNIIKITISGYDKVHATYWQYGLKQKDNGWAGLPNFVDGNLNQDAESACYRLTAADVTALKAYGLAIQGYYITITKVELLTVSSTETLFNESKAIGEAEADHVDLSWAKIGKLNETFINDFICVTYSCTSSTGDYDTYISIANPTGWNCFTLAAKKGLTPGTAVNLTFTYSVSDAFTLEAIQQSGLRIIGKKATVTKIELLKGTERFNAVPLEIGEDGICTYSSSKNLDFSGISGATPYYVSATTEGSVTLTSVEKTRNWVGYIVKGTAGKYSIPVADSEPAWLSGFENLIWTSDYDNNKVYRSVFSTYDEGGDRETQIKTKYRYIFAKKGSEIGFHLLPTDYSEGGKPYHLLGRHKAYLETATNITPTSGSRISLNFDDSGATGVNEVKGKKVDESGEYYDLMGRKVAQPTRGLYIVNGKKIVIK